MFEDELTIIILVSVLLLVLSAIMHLDIYGVIPW